ncbi:MAG TPA: GvpL/GvpF family gas vesicle protein, partial [Nocardioidaceae bacterium]|nr:GvpL/GvpF family gas vesicle protein [Nocardioidaceae bacterium]
MAEQATGHGGRLVGRGRYLYAVSRGLPPDALADVPGLGDGRLEVLEHQGLSAVVSDVDLEEYGEEGLRRNLERLDWLEEVARRHDEVVHAVAEHGPVAPLRLATICLDD